MTKNMAFYFPILLFLCSFIFPLFYFPHSFILQLFYIPNILFSRSFVFPLFYFPHSFILQLFYIPNILFYCSFMFQLFYFTAFFYITFLLRHLVLSNLNNVSFVNSSVFQSFVIPLIIRWLCIFSIKLVFHSTNLTVFLSGMCIHKRWGSLLILYSILYSSLACQACFSQLFTYTIHGSKQQMSNQIAQLKTRQVPIHRPYHSELLCYP